MMKYQNSTLEITIAVVVIASMLVLSVLVFVTQEANATASTKVSVKQTQVNKCTECKMQSYRYNNSWIGSP